MKKADHYKAVKQIRTDLRAELAALKHQLEETRLALSNARDTIDGLKAKKFALLEIVGDAIAAGKIDRPENWAYLHRD